MRRELLWVAERTIQCYLHKNGQHVFDLNELHKSCHVASWLKFTYRWLRKVKRLLGRNIIEGRNKDKILYELDGVKKILRKQKREPFLPKSTVPKLNMEVGGSMFRDCFSSNWPGNLVITHGKIKSDYSITNFGRKHAWRHWPRFWAWTMMLMVCMDYCPSNRTMTQRASSMLRLLGFIEIR